MPKPRKSELSLPAPIQLPLFPEAASLVRIRPEKREWRYCRLTVWPDLFGRALLARHWGRIGTQVGSGSTHTPTRAPPSTLSSRLVRTKRRRGYWDRWA